MSKCKKCGHEIEEGDVFCVNCGNKVDDSIETEFDNTKNKKEEDNTYKEYEDTKEHKNKKDVDDDNKPISPYELEEMNPGEIYHSTSRTTKARLIFYGVIALIVLTLIVSLSALVKDLVSNPRSEMTDCPYECCPLEENSSFLKKTCTEPNTRCVNFSCVKDECPFECCTGKNYETKGCEAENNICVNNTCVKEDCPFECCTGSEGYQPKICVNNGSCVNNECLLEPCPDEFECCKDEIDYEDRSCSPGNICVDRECKVAFIEIIKNYVAMIYNIFKTLL